MYTDVAHKSYARRTLVLPPVLATHELFLVAASCQAVVAEARERWSSCSEVWWPVLAH